MRYAMLLFLLLPAAGQAYVSLRAWQLLPAAPALRIAVVALMTLAYGAPSSASARSRNISC